LNLESQFWRLLPSPSGHPWKIWQRVAESNSHPCGAPVFRTGGGPSTRTLCMWSTGRTSNPITPGLQSGRSSSLRSGAL